MSEPAHNQMVKSSVTETHKTNSMKGQEDPGCGAATWACATEQTRQEPGQLQNESSVGGWIGLGSQLGGQPLRQLSADGGIPSPLGRCKARLASSRYREQHGFLKCQVHQDFKERYPNRSEKPNLPCDLLQSPNPASTPGPPS